jgi:hypothetical protein
MRRRALMAASQSSGEQGGGLTFPVYLIAGNNGELGIAVFNYFKENYSFGFHTLDDKTQVYVDNELQSSVVVTAFVTFSEGYILTSEGYCNLGT